MLGRVSSRIVTNPRSSGDVRSSEYRPGDGTPGGVRDGAVAFRAGLGGFGASSSEAIEYAPNAVIDSRFSSGQPGTYVLRMVLVGHPFNQETTPFYDPEPWNRALRAKGLDATVTSVRYVENRNPRTVNWAQDVLSNLFGGSDEDNQVVDMVFDVTVTLGPGAAGGMNGMGAVQIGAAGVIAIVAVIAIVIAVSIPGADKVILDGVRFVGKAAGETVGGAAGAVAGNAVPLLIVVGVAALGIFMLKKGGASFKSKGGAFSF